MSDTKLWPNLKKNQPPLTFLCDLKKYRNENTCRLRLKTRSGLKGLHWGDIGNLVGVPGWIFAAFEVTKMPEATRGKRCFEAPPSRPFSFPASNCNVFVVVQLNLNLRRGLWLARCWFEYIMISKGVNSSYDKMSSKKGMLMKWYKIRISSEKWSLSPYLVHQFIQLLLVSLEMVPLDSFQQQCRYPVVLSKPEDLVGKDGGVGLCATVAGHEVPLPHQIGRRETDICPVNQRSLGFRVFWLLFLKKLLWLKDKIMTAQLRGEYFLFCSYRQLPSRSQIFGGLFDLTWHSSRAP